MRVAPAALDLRPLMLQELSKLFTQGVSGWIAGILLILYLLYAAGCTVKLWGWDLRKHRLPNRIVFPFVFATTPLCRLLLL